MKKLLFIVILMPLLVNAQTKIIPQWFIADTSDFVKFNKIFFENEVFRKDQIRSHIIDYLAQDGTIIEYGLYFDENDSLVDWSMSITAKNNDALLFIKKFTNKQFTLEDIWGQNSILIFTYKNKNYKMIIQKEMGNNYPTGNTSIFIEQKIH